MVNTKSLATDLKLVRTALGKLGLSGSIIGRHGIRAFRDDPIALLAYWRSALHHLSTMWGTGIAWRVLPVDIDTFVDSSDMLNKSQVLYPKVRESLREMTSGKYVEAVLTGGIGTAKTTLAIYSIAYELYVLSCMRSPHATFELDPSSEIEMIFQSVNRDLAKTVDYARFRDMIRNSPYFEEHFSFDTNKELEMAFPNRIIIKPVSGTSMGAIGQNVIGGLIDELNFMALVEDSKLSLDGGAYDQAVDNYNAIARRRESRFMRMGWMPGILCLVSSSRYPGQFTDRKKDEHRRQVLEHGKSNIYVYDRRTWEVVPPGRFSGQMFKVFVGDLTRKPRILEEYEVPALKDDPLVMDVPVEYRKQFDNDLLAALRDIAGVSTMALHPFMLDNTAVNEAFKVDLPSILSRPDVDFIESQLEVYPDRFRMLRSPRFVHIDLAVTGDSAGVACGYVDGFVRVQRTETEFEVLPRVVFDFTLEVRPPRNGEIQFEKIRRLLYLCRQLGLLIRWVSMDSYQSTDTLQILAGKGFITGMESMDVSTLPYDVSKQAFYDRRVQAPEHRKALEEWVRLERDVKKNKIDHPPKGSKDVSDAMAGVIYGLTFRREIWHLFKVPLGQVPKSLLQLTEPPTKKVRGMFDTFDAEVTEELV